MPVTMGATPPPFGVMYLCVLLHPILWYMADGATPPFASPCLWWCFRVDRSGFPVDHGNLALTCMYTITLLLMKPYIYLHLTLQKL